MCVHVPGYVCLQLEKMYKDAHAKIRADPSFTKKDLKADIKKKRFVLGHFKSLFMRLWSRRADDEDYSCYS